MQPLSTYSRTVLLNQAYGQFCSTSIRRHDASVFVFAKYCVMHCYQLVLETNCYQSPWIELIFQLGVRGISHLGYDVIPCSHKWKQKMERLSLAHLAQSTNLQQ